MFVLAVEKNRTEHYFFSSLLCGGFGSRGSEN